MDHNQSQGIHPEQNKRRTSLKKKFISWYALLCIPIFSGYLVMFLITHKTGEINTWVMLTVMITAVAVLLSILFIGNRIVITVIEPLKRLQRQTEKVRDGRFDISSISTYGKDEISELTGKFGDMAEHLKHLYTRIEDEKKKLETILEHLGAGLLIANEQNIIQIWNRKAAELTGMDSEQAVGRFFEDAFTLVDDNEGIIDLDAVCKRCMSDTRIHFSEPWDHYHLLNHQTEKTIPVSYIVSPLLDKEGSASGIIFIFNDISKQKEMEQFKSSIIATAVHQFRLPITKIANAIYLLQSSQPGAADEKYFSAILEHINELNSRINRYLNAEMISRIYKKDIHIEYINIISVLKRCVDEMKIIFEKKNILLSCPILNHSDPSVASPNRLMLKIDRKHFEEALDIILDNALKYTPPGGRVDVSAHENNGYIRITVKDSGRGLSRNELETLRTFKKFNRFCPEVKGTGLGLSICNEIMTRVFNGRILVESAPCKGSVFTLEFPKIVDHIKQGEDGNE